MARLCHDGIHATNNKCSQSNKIKRKQYEIPVVASIKGQWSIYIIGNYMAPVRNTASVIEAVT